jgi:heme A synthase
MPGRAKSDDKRLDRQQAYQHFHIGIYMSLATAIMGASFFSGDKVAGLDDRLKLLLLLVVVFLLLAGAFGGMVASRIPASPSYEFFSRVPYGPALPGKKPENAWPWLRWKAPVWESCEHLAFWIAMVILVVFTVGFITNLDRGIAGHVHAEVEISARP